MNMRVGYFILSLNLLLLCGTVSAETIHVPATHLTIQAAIDDAVDGDTVLVAPGTYLETIDFNGRNIVVGSHFLLDNDTSFIRQTIIDASHRLYVVRFENSEDSTAHLCGFTIRNGGAAEGDDAFSSSGGISIWGDANPHLSWLYVTENDGGESGAAISVFRGNPLMEHITVINNSGVTNAGVRLNESSAIIRNSLIAGNSIARQGDGGGLRSRRSSPLLENVTITKNRATRGGGVYCFSSDLVLRNVRIIGNTAFQEGGGIFLANSALQFDAQARSSIYLNRAVAGRDFYINDTSSVHLYADTLTVIAPTEDDIAPLNNYTIDVQAGALERVSADLYVDPAGSDNNSGLSAAEPLRTIAAAIVKIEADNLNPRSIFLADGIYSESTTGEFFPVIAKDHVTLDGASRDNTVLDAEGKTAVIRFRSPSALTIQDLTIQGSRKFHRGISGDTSVVSLVNLQITGNQGGGIELSHCTGNLDNLLVTNNNSELYGGVGLSTWNSILTIDASSFSGNTGLGGGGAEINGGSAVILDVEFSDNHVTGTGGGLIIKNGPATLNGVILRDNSASFGGGMVLSNADTCFVDNATIENNFAQASGGGIDVRNAPLILSNTTIRQNRAESGGGISLWFSAYAAFENTSISRNTADANGGGVYLDPAAVVDFSATDRSSIYLNGAASAADLFTYGSSVFNMVLDTFTVANPTSYHAESLENFTFNIQTPYFSRVAADLYVSPTGDDLNNGLSEGQPLKTIAAALSRIEADSLSPRSIFLADGVYSPSTSGELFPLNMLSYVNLIGTSSENTILDAAGESRVLNFNQDSTISVENLTIRGGYSHRSGGGLNVLHSVVDFNNIILTKNHSTSGGGGLSISDSEVSISSSKMIENSTDASGGAGAIGDMFTIDDVEIAGNVAAVSGGGFFVAANQSFIRNSRFQANAAFYGGGLYLNEDSNPELAGVTITENFASYYGGGLYFEDTSRVVFDENNLSNIYLNYAGAGSDLYADNPSAADVVIQVDTFTVVNPTDHHALSKFLHVVGNRFQWDIENGKTSQVAADLYVDPNGDDLNSGLSAGAPLASIGMALTKIIADSLNPRTIHLAPGTYADSVGGEVFPLNMNSYTTLAGSGMESTTLDGRHQKTPLFFYEDQNAMIRDLSLTNGNGNAGGGIHIDESLQLDLLRLTISNSHSNLGGGVYIRHSAVVDLRESIIKDNSASYNGGGVYVDDYLYSIIRLQRSLITNNIAGNRGGGLYNEDNAFVYNTTISGNEASAGGGIFSVAFTRLANSIVWDNHPEELANESISSSRLYVAFSNIKGDSSGIAMDSPWRLIWQEGNIASDPQFIDPGAGNYLLDPASPAINAGTDLLLSDVGDTLLYLTPDEYFGIAPDMGAFEDDTTTAVTRVELPPLRFALHQNYPNPFNPATRIPYSISRAGKVSITLFDVLGRKVRTLQKGYHAPGNYVYHFDARNLPSGFYFYHLQAENGPQLVRKMLLLR